MGKKTPSASSESVVTTSSSPPEASYSRNNSVVSEADTITSTDTADGGKGPKKLGLIKRMSLRRSERKKEKEKKEEMEKEEKAREKEEKAREKEEKAKEKEKARGKEKEKVKEKDKKKDKKKEKDKANEKDKHIQDGQKKTAEDIYTKISMDDFEAKQVEFKLWMLEQQNGSIDTLKPSKVKSFFKKFVKEWNKKRLPQRYYWSSEETPPPSRAGSRFSFAEDVQTPDFLNFPAAPVDLSNDDLDSNEDIERSGSFSTFGKTQKPEGLNDEVTPTMPKRPLLSAVFPVIDPSCENSARVSPTVSKMMAQAVVICEDHVAHSDPPTPTPETSALTHPNLSPQGPVLLTYEQSPGITNGALKERYAITPDNNNIKLNESNEVCDSEGSNYTCMENDVLPGEELKVTEILERAIQEDLLPSGELTPIAEEESAANDTKHVIKMQTVVEALQPVAEKKDVAVEDEPKVSKSEASVETTWEVVDSKAESGQITFSGLPPPPKEWKMDPMGLTHTILPTARPVSQERTVTTAEVITHPNKRSEETTRIIKTTTVTTVEQITSEGKSIEAEQVSRVATSPTIKSPVIAVHDNQVLPSPIQQEERTVKIESQEIRSPVLPETPVVHLKLEREAVRSPTVTSPSTVTLECVEPSPTNQRVTVVGLEKLEIKPPVVTERSSATTSPPQSSVTFVAQELKSPTMKVEQPVVVQQTSVVSKAPTSSSVEEGKVFQPDIQVAVCPTSPEPKTVTIQPRSLSIPETSHVTLAHQELHSPVSKPAILLPEQGDKMICPEVNYTRVSPERETYVIRTSVAKQQDEREVTEVSSQRQKVETSSMSSSDVENTSVEHTVVTRSTPQVLQTSETKSTNAIYREHASVTSHIPRPTSKGAHLPLILQESITVTNKPVSPTNTVTRDGIRPVRPAPPPPETKHKATTVERRTVSTSSASPRNSAEMKHHVTTEPPAERKRGPALSPIIVGASAVPMLFQDAMKPVEQSSSGSKHSTSPPKGAPMRSPRSPDKPKPAPRPSSLRSPTSPGSHIPVAVKAEPVSPAKSPRQEVVPPPKAPRPQSFRSSTQLVMTTSPPPTQTSPKARVVTPTTPSNTGSGQIPPPKAPRPARSPVSSQVVTFPNTTAYTQPVHMVQHNVVSRSVEPTSHAFTDDSSSTMPVHTRPAPTNAPETQSYSKFMYEQPSFLAARKDSSRRSMSRINFTPPKPSSKTRMTTSYIETSPALPTENAMSVSYSDPSSLKQNQSSVNQSDPSYRITEQTKTISFSQPSKVNVEDINTVQPRENVMSVSYSEPSTRTQDQNGMTTAEQSRAVSFTQASPVTVEHTRTVYSTSYSSSPQQTSEVEYDDSLVRPEQTRTTFGPTFMRLSGDRRSLSRIEGVRYQQNVQHSSEPGSHRREVHTEQGRPNPFHGHVRMSSSSNHERDANATNVVNKYLAEIKESTQVISFSGDTTQPEKARPLSQGEGEAVQVRRTVQSNVDHQTVPREATVTTYEVSHSRSPLYGTSAYKENEAPSHVRQPPPLAPRQYSSLPRNNRGVAMGAMVVEMGASHPARSQLEMSRSRSSYAGYPVCQEFETSSDGRSYAGHPTASEFQTPRDRRSYAGYSPGYSPSQPGISPGQQGVSPSYVFSGYHGQKHLSLPRSRSSYAGTSAPSSLTPEEMARLQEVLRSPRS